MARHSLIAAAGTLLSRVLGFVRDAAIAWLLGASPVADALTTALRLPWVARRMYGEGTLSLDMATFFTRWRQALSRTGYEALVLAVYRRATLWACLLVLPAFLFAGSLVAVLAPGLVQQDEVYRQAVLLTRLCLPYLIFLLPAAVCMAYLHSQGSFLLPSLMPCCFNLVVLAGAGLAALGVGSAPFMLAVGVVLGGFVQWQIQARAINIRLFKRQDAARLADNNVAAGTIARRYPESVFFAAVPQCTFLLAACLTSLLPAGSLAGLFYAERLMEFPLGMLGAALGMAAAPHFARVMNEEGASALGLRLRLVVGASLAGALPACAGLVAVAVPVTDVLFGHGAFDRPAVEATASLVCALAPGIPAYAASRPLLAACHVLEARRVMYFSAVLALVGTAGCGWLLMRIAGPVGPPLGASAGLWLYALGMWHGTSKLTGGALRLDRIQAVRGLVWILASLLTYVAATACLMDGRPLASLGLAVPAGACVYIAFVAVFDSQSRAFCAHTLKGLYTSRGQE